MKYYYVEKVKNYYTIFGTSGAGLIRKTMGIEFNQEGYLVYPEPIKLCILGEEQEKRLFFPKYEKLHTYILTLMPEIKSIFEQFNMPEHRWYKAEVVYDLEFIQNMKHFFRIEYDIDINEKRNYWILQFLDREFQELDYQNINFNVVDFKNREIKKSLFKGEVINYDEYILISKREYFKNNNEYLVKPSKYIYCKNYDILWGGSHIVFNEKVKEALEATNIITHENGLEFVEFTDYEIEMLGK